MNKNEKKHQFKSFFPISADAMNRMPGQEKTTKRTRSSKIFDLGRNLHQAVLFADPVHYRDKHTGEWCEIDNTLINKADKNGNVYLTNHSNGELKVELHRTDSPYTVLLQNENNNVLSWMLEDAEVVMPVRLNRPCREHSDCDLRRDVLAHLESEVVYSNIFPDADMHCYIQSVSFKDEIIFKNKNAVRPITFLLSTPDMVPTPRENGSIDLVATSGEIVFSLPKPFMKDTSPAEKVGTVSYTLHPTSERDLWRMTYTPDVEWLKTAQFPVVLDPAVVTPNLSSGFTDLHISSNSPSSVQSSGDQLIRLARNDSTYGNITALFKYANAALPNIDSSYYVTKAFLTLKTGSVYTAQAVALKEITADWNASTVTWNSIINGISSKVSDYVYMSNSNTEYQYDISNLVRKWYTNANDNHGFALEVMGTGLIDICTSNNATFTPYLTINYTSLAGLENYLAYEQQSAGRAGTGYVNCEINNEEASLAEFSYAVTIGGVAGIAGGSGINVKVKNEIAETAMQTIAKTTSRRRKAMYTAKIASSINQLYIGTIRAVSAVGVGNLGNKYADSFVHAVTLLGE